VTQRRTGEVLLIGAGRMGGALLGGWIAAGRFSSIHVVEPAPAERLKTLADGRAVVLHAHFEEAATLAPQAVVLALKPQVLKTESTLLQRLGRMGALVISIAAGVTTTFLGAGLGSRARLVRAMPNTPGAIGRGITALYGDTAVSPADRVLAESLMAPLGETLWIADEALMDAVTAVSGSGPAYVFLFAEALAEAGRAEGLDEAAAAKLARATIAGAGALLAADSRAAAELRREVTSPGGTTEAALKVLMAADGLRPLIRRAIAAATERGKELGKD
jgi:pyrroline-5-carboxylate reductase